MIHAPTDPQWFRKVLGQLPTGVCAVTAIQQDGLPVGMAVGSFTSVSLDPPLVGFFPDRSSSSWPKIAATGRFCVNILSSGQEPVCRQLASKAANKFEGLGHRPASSGAPILDGAVAWVDCDLHSVQDAGDHYFVLGAVRALEIETAELPLLFFQGGYGRFSPMSLAAPDLTGALSEPLRLVDKARGEMDRLCQSLSAGCIATIRVQDELMIAACAGVAEHTAISALVGQRLPFMPPTGSIFAAWTGDDAIAAWSGAFGRDAAEVSGTLRLVRARGYSVGLLNEAQRAFVQALTSLADRPSPSAPTDLRDLVQQLAYDPPELTPEARNAVRLVSAPVFDPAGQVAVALTLFDFPKPREPAGVGRYIEALLTAAARVTERIGGRRPGAPS